MDVRPTVFILDDDQSFLSALSRLVQAEGFKTREWSSAIQFLSEHDPDEPGCLLCDLRMPQMSGLELQRVMLAAGERRAIVFISGQADIPAAVAGMRAGAITFLAKPARGADIVNAIREAIDRDLEMRAEDIEYRRVRLLVDSLTPRELQVLELVAKGMLNKQIAGTLGAAEKTIKVHRGRIMKKMQVKSVAVLVQMLPYGRERSLPPHLPLGA